MSEATLAVVSVLIFAWAVSSGSLARHSATGPLVFTAAGFLLANPDWGVLAVDVDAAVVHALAEVTLALVLFSDASRVRISELREDLALPMRLLTAGLALTLIAGGVTAAVVFDHFEVALAAFVAAALTPTDAALSVQVINDERVPLRLRRALNVESGLNDGIVTPIVTLTLFVAASQLGIDAESEAAAAGSAIRELGAGLAVGLAVGWIGALVVNIASKRGWAASGGRRIATLALALGAFAVAVAVDGNGFIAAFVAGIAFAAVLDQEEADLEWVMELPDLTGELLALIVWFVFGATLVPIAFDHLDTRVVVYAVLSLTVVRMLPVAVSMAGARLDRRSVLFLAWFGPRGLASVVFALLAVEQLGEPAGEAVAVVALTVLGSVVLHGVTAGPAGRRFGRVGTTSSAHQVGLES